MLTTELCIQGLRKNRDQVLQLG